MSAKSIKAYSAVRALRPRDMFSAAPVDVSGVQRRHPPTLTPPPCGDVTAADCLAQAAEYEAQASRLLARANDLRVAAARKNPNHDH